MNAAFLLVTTAWLAGADPVDPKADPKDPKDHKPVVVAPAPSSCCGGGCGSCCDTGCEGREGLLSRLRNKFRRDDCGDSCGCEREGLLDRLRNRFRKDDCCDSGCGYTTTWKGSCGSACDSCCERERLLDRLRNRFRKNDCCGCPTDCCGTVVVPRAEQLGAPKDGEHHKPLPKGNGGSGGKDDKGGENKEVRVIPQPIMAPALEATPITAPKAPPVGVEKSPF